MQRLSLGHRLQRKGHPSRTDLYMMELQDAACTPDCCDGPPKEGVVLDIPADNIGIELGRSKARKEGGCVQQGR